MVDYLCELLHLKFWYEKQPAYLRFIHAEILFFRMVFTVW